MNLNHLNVTRVVSVPLALFALASFSACSSASEDGQSWVEAPLDEEAATVEDGAPRVSDPAFGESLATLRQPLTGTHKLCSVFLAGNWRDSLIVPDGWTADDCRAFALAQSMPANAFNLACVGDDGFFGFGAAGGGIPPLNPCGW